MRLLLLLLAVTAAGLDAAAQAEPRSQGSHRIEVTLERLEKTEWRAVDPGLVFNSDDRVRFRIRTDFDGYLYVMNQGTTGRYTLLFPGDETGRENDIKAGKEYLVPATQAWFRIGGPPGHDVVYWLVSPVVLSGPGHEPPAPPPQANRPLQKLMPRCDDALLRARGACIDSSAGLRGIPDQSPLPENLAQISGASRDLVIIRKENLSVISSPMPLQEPVIYEFRLAHR